MFKLISSLLFTAKLTTEQEERKAAHPSDLLIDKLYTTFCLPLSSFKSNSTEEMIWHLFWFDVNRSSGFSYN